MAKSQREDIVIELALSLVPCSLLLTQLPPLSVTSLWPVSPLSSWCMTLPTSQVLRTIVLPPVHQKLLDPPKSLSLLSCVYNMFWYVLKTVLTFTSCVEVHLCLLLLFPCLLSSVFLLLRLPHCVLASYPGHLANSLNTRCSYPDCSTCT